MSLTRTEWIEMWENIKTIEKELEDIVWCDSLSCNKYNETKPNVKFIKDKIQQVIGQME